VSTCAGSRAHAEGISSPKSGVIWVLFGRHSGKTTYKEPVESLAQALANAQLARRVREGEDMDRRILFVILGAAALALAGLAFAAGGQGWNVTGFGPQDWNGTRMAAPAGENGTFRGHAMLRGNGTEELNRTAREDEAKQFEQAVLADDYSAAKSLNTQYGVGGPMFGKLNETTFAKFSQIAVLESQLRQELGMNATGMMPPLIGGPEFGNGPGMKGGRGMMAPDFAKGMGHGNKQATNQTAGQ
jgi:hypothetical protein